MTSGKLRERMWTPPPLVNPTSRPRPSVNSESLTDNSEKGGTQVPWKGQETRAPALKARGKIASKVVVLSLALFAHEDQTI